MVRLGTGGAFRVELDRAEVAPRDMVRVRPVPPVLRGFNPSVSIPPFWMDRFEVTNRQYKEFVDQGGYRRQEFWEHPFAKDGKALSWEEAMALFRDTTGRPGPATWALGSYPDGQDEFPVAGVSWYEAAAFARFAGKSLPTVHHWAVASGRGALGGAIIPRSNLGGAGPAEVGHPGGWGRSAPTTWPATSRSGASTAPATGSATSSAGPGTSGMPCSGATTPEPRPTGGRTWASAVSWTCPARHPRRRPSRRSGRTYRDFSAEKPMSDDAFQVVKGYYAYDKAKPLDAVVEGREETASWVHGA